MFGPGELLCDMFQGFETVGHGQCLRGMFQGIGFLGKDIACVI